MAWYSLDSDQMVVEWIAWGFAGLTYGIIMIIQGFMALFTLFYFSSFSDTELLKESLFDFWDSVSIYVLIIFSAVMVVSINAAIFYYALKQIDDHGSKED
eukprot:CAMPEP_0176354442 /NCGR_PEP_ID=MMETSP0126-20121128/12560_1 /TAXON_ID=141414 ORGANISM="Strombidinopsis acuminatum, Strain SPMC142" /NCGR_SAMPLE_ID=MMETSP0126 /ASSEMBLY_ACC=CAM_ASM_000229 /LENGTH=99 /DNA_ID=CAMNT_0017706619 /DNA_START=392 /DNA_END=691 /DNA_ORIENTATION=+